MKHTLEIQIFKYLRTSYLFYNYPFALLTFTTSITTQTNLHQKKTYLRKVRCKTVYVFCSGPYVERTRAISQRKLWKAYGYRNRASHVGDRRATSQTSRKKKNYCFVVYNQQHIRKREGVSNASRVSTCANFTLPYANNMPQIT